MNKLKVLVTAELVRDKMNIVSSDFELEYSGYAIDREVMPHDELKKRIADKDILVCEYDTIDDDILSSAHHLKLIVCCRGGVSSVVDIQAAKRRGISICNTAGRNADAVADLTLGYIFDLTRNITKSNNLIHSGVLVGDKSSKPAEYKDTVWGLGNDSPFIKYRGRSINQMSLGIVGFGYAGRALAKKASLLGMRIFAYSPRIIAANVPSYVSVVSLDELIRGCDVVSVNCALNSETRNMFNSAVFASMKPGSYFINTSRGEIVVEDDLVSALTAGRLAGAAIDVTRQEPVPPNSPLINAPNLIVTPHIGGSSDDVQRQGTEIVINTLLAWRDGDSIPNCILSRE